MTALYNVLVKIDESLPWIELKGEYVTRKEAREAAQRAFGKIVFKFVNVPDERKAIKTFVTVKARR